MGKSIMPFDYNGKEVRTITDENGEPWFVGKDVAETLGYVNPTKAIRVHCRKGSKMDLESGRGMRETTIIPESDVYRLVMKSQLESANRFEDWVVEDVLPSIRKTGVYKAPSAVPATPAEMFMQSAQAMVDLEQHQKAQEKTLDIIRPPKRVKIQPTQNPFIAFYPQWRGTLPSSMEHPNRLLNALFLGQNGLVKTISGPCFGVIYLYFK